MAHDRGLSPVLFHEALSTQDHAFSLELTETCLDASLSIADIDVQSTNEGKHAFSG